MKGTRICLAGVNWFTGEHVRATTDDGDELSRELLVENGGPLSVGSRVDLGAVTATPSHPRTEDHLFDTENLEPICVLTDDKFLELLGKVSAPSLQEAFGPALEQRGPNKLAVTPGTGSASLAVIKPSQQPFLNVSTYGKVQLKLSQPTGPIYLPVTDYRYYEDDQKTIRAGRVSDVAERLAAGTPVFLALGLTTPFSKTGEDQPLDWLQVNNLILEDRPVGQVP
jgi:hypothetical protein